MLYYKIIMSIYTETPVDWYSRLMRILWTVKKNNQSNKSSQIFHSGHKPGSIYLIIWEYGSLQKAVRLGKVEGKIRRGQSVTRCMGSAAILMGTQFEDLKEQVRKDCHRQNKMWSLRVDTNLLVHNQIQQIENFKILADFAKTWRLNKAKGVGSIGEIKTIIIE